MRWRGEAYGPLDQHHPMAIRTTILEGGLEVKAWAVILLVLAIVASSVTTYFLFPQVVVEEPPTTTVKWVVQNGYHYTAAMVIDEFDLMEKYSDGRVSLEVVILKGAAVSESTLSGAVHFAQRAAPGVLVDIQNGAPFKILLSMGAKKNGLWSSDPDVRSIEDITKDTIVNVVSPNTNTEIGLGLALQRLGRPKDAYTATYLKHPDAYQAMLSREIDVEYTGAPYWNMYASEPDRFQVIGDDEALFDVAMAGSVVFVNTEWADANPDIIAAALAAWFEAISWIEANQEEAAKLNATFYGSPLDTVWKMWQDADLAWGPTTGLSGISTLSEVFFQAGTLERAFSDEEVLYFTSLGRCLP